ncbi:MAG: zinc ribbon domain-containing protein [Nitrososphaerales archaeon]
MSKRARNNNNNPSQGRETLNVRDTPLASAYLTKIWELALGIIMVAVSFPLLLISVFVASILPSAGGIAIVTLFLVALGIGLMHDSTYQPKSKTPAAQPPTTPKASNYCIKCGTQLDKGAEFCGSCGNPVPNRQNPD